MRKTLLSKLWLLLLCTIVGVNSAWAQSDKSTVYTSNVTLPSSGTNVSSCVVVINSNNYDGVKLGKSGTGASASFTAPAGTKYIHLHVAAWNTKSPGFTYTVGTGTAQTISGITSDSGIAGNSPFTFSGNPSSVNYYKVITLASALENATSITFSSTSERAVFWGVNTEAESSDEATSVTIDASGITNTDIASGTAAGSLSAVVKNSSSVAIDGASVTWSSSNTNIATIDASTGIVTLVKKGSTTITASYSGVVGKYQSSNNTYILNVTNSASGDGTSSHPFTISEARDALDASEIDSETDYYARGYIAKIGTFKDGALTYWLSDDGSMTNSIQCYKGKNVNGAAFESESDLEVGDIATVKGKLTIYSGTTYEFTENNEVVSITERTKVNIATFTATTNPLILGETTTTNTTVTNDQSGWTPVSYTYESDDETVATVNESGVITAVAKGTANITVTPVVSATDPLYKVGNSKSIEITVSNPSHTATFSVNGVTTDASVEEGEAITFPTDPAGIGGKTFMGWSTTAISGITDTKPTFVSSATMSTSDITYYAVFATKESVSGEITKTYGFESSTDDDWTVDGPARTEGESKTGSYSGKINSNHTYVTFNSKVKVKDFSFSLKRTSNNSNYNVYIETSSDNSTWTAAATFAMSDFSNGSYTTKNKTFDGKTDLYVRFHCYNTTAVRYVDDISIKYDGENISYSAYCTSVPTSVPVSISGAGYKTFCSAYPLNFTGSGVKAYIASASAKTVTFTEVESVPANTGILLKGSEGDYDIAIEANSTDVSSNVLVGVTAATEMPAGIFVLMNGTSGVGFYKTTKAFTVGANTAYLPAEVAAGRMFIGFNDEEEVTGINEVKTLKNYDAIYDLRGMRVTTPKKGLYIKGGKKIVFK